MTELASRAKFNELIGVLQEAAVTWVVPGPGQEFDPDRPAFNRIEPPTRSFTG